MSSNDARLDRIENNISEIQNGIKQLNHDNGEILNNVKKTENGINKLTSVKKEDGFICAKCELPVLENQEYCANCNEELDWNDVSED